MLSPIIRMFLGSVTLRNDFYDRALLWDVKKLVEQRPGGPCVCKVILV